MRPYYVWLLSFTFLCIAFAVITFQRVRLPVGEEGKLVLQADHYQRSHGRNLAAAIKASPPVKRSATTQSYKNVQPARFLLGIFTIAEESSKRNMIRSAFALYNDTRLCPLGPSSSNDHRSDQLRRGCELLYTFVIGANPNGKTQLVLDASASNVPLLTTPPPGFDSSLEPNDITFLNIQENMNYGKTPTWFHYASQVVMNMYDLDYVVKCDTDTYVMVDKFFDISKIMFSRGRSQTYGGFAVWSYPQRHIYMEGQFYLLSRDLAELVGSVSLNHTQDILFVEDADTGLVLMKHRHQVTHLVSMEKLRSWKHPLKNASTFGNFMIEESFRLGRPIPGTTLPPSVKV